MRSLLVLILVALEQACPTIYIWRAENILQDFRGLQGYKEQIAEFLYYKCQQRSSWYEGCADGERDQHGLG